MRTVGIVGSFVVLAGAVGGCGKASKSNSGSSGSGVQEPPKNGIALRSFAGVKPLTADAEFVRLLGVGPNGEELDFGELHKEMALDHGYLTSLPPSKPANWAELPLISGSRTFVVIVDANRAAKDVQAAIAKLDKACWGFGVEAGGKLGVALPAPCPMDPASSPEEERIDLQVIVGPDKVRFAETRVNEVQTAPRSELQAKLAEYKKEAFFAGDPCPATRPEPERPDEGDETGGTGTAMAMAEMTSGRCDVLVTFDDAAKVGDVIDVFQSAMSAGFTEPHWMRPDQLQPVTQHPPVPPPPPPPDTPEYRAADEAVQKAQKKKDDAMAEVLAITKDSTKSVSDIKAATEREKKAEEELKAAKKKRREARDKANASK
jgi:hypothetical protein